MIFTRLEMAFRSILMAATVAKQMMEKAGIDVDLLIKKLNKALAAEITTYYCYTVLRNHPVGEDLKGITENARLEDTLHFEVLVPRVYELGGDIYRDMKDLHDAASSAAYLPQGITVNTVHNESTNKKILEMLLDAKRCAVRVYTDICDQTHGKDPRTHDLSLAILHEEFEHELWFEEMLEGEPSGHFGRRAPGEGPFTQEFRHIE